MKWLAPIVIGIAALGGGFGFGLIMGPNPSDISPTVRRLVLEPSSRV